MLARLDIETSFVEGLRVTDSDTVDVAEMVLCGKINKGIASSIKQAGGRAVGLSGKDDNLILAEKLQKVITDPGTGQSKMLDLGYVGEIKKVNTKVISDLVAAGIIPVIAPIGVDERGQTYNCNADTAAGAIAAALKANRLLLLTDVKGVLNKEGVLLEVSHLCLLIVF
jgi:acetylglutamate kinase